MTTANERQVGGSHYVGAFQHWDLAAQYRMGYFEGQITKYTTRHAKKNGLQDVEKAIHFLEKLIEVVERSYDCPWYVKLFAPWVVRQRQGKTPTYSELERFARCNELGFYEEVVVSLVSTWCSPADLHGAMAYLRFIERHYLTNGFRSIPSKGGVCPCGLTEEACARGYCPDTTPSNAGDEGDAGPEYVNQDR